MYKPVISVHPSVKV